MKKIKFNKNVKLLLFCILSIITINALYTYQDYQNEKNKPEHISSSLNIVKNINDDLSLRFGSFEDIVKNNINRNYFLNFMAFDDSLNLIYNNNFNDIGFSYETENISENLISLKHFDLQTLKNIYTLLHDSVDKKEKVVATFNYDAIKDDGTIVIKEILYFEINGTVFYNGNFDNLISKEITFLSTPFGDYGIDENDNIYINDYDYNIYNYLADSLNDVVASKKFDDNGYYEVINPVNDYIHPIDYYDENDQHIKADVKICFQILDYKYGAYYTDEQTEEKLYGSYHPDSGYIVWYDYERDGNSYTFVNYLSDHYFNYLISLLIIIVSYFVIKKINHENNTIIVEKEENIIPSKPKREVFNKESVDLEKQLTQLYNNSKNLLVFKKLNLNYLPNDLVVLGNKNELTKVINDTYYFIINHSHPNDTLTIKIENKTIYFINNDHSITNKELEELNDIFEIIEAHDFNYQKKLNIDNYQIIINAI